MRVDGIIFDVDGTLWDSTEIVAGAWNQAIIEEGITDVHLTGEIEQYTTQCQQQNDKYVKKSFYTHVYL